MTTEIARVNATMHRTSDRKGALMNFPQSKHIIKLVIEERNQKWRTEKILVNTRLSNCLD
jgi:hypothetical protein